MNEPADKVRCPGCWQKASDNRNIYCPTCKDALQRQQCFLCGESITTDIPNTTCDDCEEWLKAEAALVQPKDIPF